MRIRPCRERDISCVKRWITSERVHDMWCAGRLPYAFQEALFWEKLKEGEAEWDQSAFTAVGDDGEPLGFFCISYRREDNSAFMSQIIVNEKERGRGYGRQMLELALCYAFTIWHVDAVRLGVFENNAPARALYAKVGFHEEEYTPEAFSHGEEKWGRYILCAKKPQENNAKAL
ncbi:MAG: GNAT family N-acetyltransferase [Lachnospiraceae bacterium]|nr:GNAT family N-acetyltransferase [Lachnospiraceae bacterium]